MNFCLFWSELPIELLKIRIRWPTSNEKSKQVFEYHDYYHRAEVISISVTRSCIVLIFAAENSSKKNIFLLLIIRCRPVDLYRIRFTTRGRNRIQISIDIITKWTRSVWMFRKISINWPKVHGLSHCSGGLEKNNKFGAAIQCTKCD